MSTTTIRKTHTRSSSAASSASRDSLSLSRGERPLSFQNFQAYHRDSSITTPVFSPKSATLEPKPSHIYDPLPQRTLEDIRDEVAARLAVRVVRKMKPIDDMKVSVALSLSKQDDEQFLPIVAGHLQRTMAQKSYLFAIATTGSGPNALIFCGSSPIQVQRAALIVSSKFIGRVQALYDEGTRWIARVHDIGWTLYDENALWDVVQKFAQQSIDPSLPPPGFMQ